MLIDEVNRLVGERAWPWKKSALASAISFKLGQIADAGECLAIPRILSLVLDSRRDVAESAARAVKELRPGVRVQDLGIFDRTFRDLSPHMHPEYMHWRSMGAKELKQVAALENGAAALQFAMCHPSGFVREEAIRLSAACADGAEIPILLLRTNDWVKPVQERAYAALRARLRPESLPALIEVLPMLEQMRKWGRLRDRAFLGEIDDLLRSPAGTTLLLECRDSDDREHRRAAFRHLAESTNVDLRDVFESALADSDPAIRSWAARRLCDSESELFLRFAESLLSNSLGAVRVQAAQRLVTLERLMPWERLLFDSHSGVRSVAQQVALAHGTSSEELYRESLSSSHGARLGAALIGLSETGGADASDIIREYLSHAAPRVRRSCLHALANLGARDLMDICLGALTDPSPGVVHAARDLLLSSDGYVSPSSVWASFERADTTWGKKDALAVLSNLDYWARLPYLLRAYTVENDDVRERASLYLTQWWARQNRVFTSPSVEIAREAREWVQAPQFSEWFRREVVAVLDTRGGAQKGRE